MHQRHREKVRGFGPHPVTHNLDTIDITVLSWALPDRERCPSYYTIVDENTVIVTMNERACRGRKEFEIEVNDV